MKRNKILPISLLLISLLILFSGCADNSQIQSCFIDSPYGFWGGLWHGIIAPFDFIGMLFSDDIAMYAPNNNGCWYAFGFLLGSGGWGLLASSGTKKK